MLAIPAIDLKGGKVVRLHQGRFEEESVYSEDPGEIAGKFEDEGASRLHVVDLDGALKGVPKNLSQIEEIIHSVKIPVEVGGGIRELSQARRYLDMGAQWVIFGTRACLDTGFLKEALKEFKSQAIVGIDAAAGQVAVDGWTRFLPVKADELAKNVQSAGGKTIIYTDIVKDGALTGPNLEQIAWMSDAVTLDVIASGGVGSLKDLKELKALGKKNIIGAIIGKALYEKKFTVREAVKACSPNA